MKEDVCFLYEDELSKDLDFLKEFENIYNAMGDSLSKKIFMNRIAFSMTREHSFMRNIIMDTKGGQKLYKYLNDVKDKEIYIYGAGKRGQRFALIFPEIEWSGFIDINKAGKIIHNIPIISIAEFCAKRNRVVVISNYEGYEEIKENLKKMNVDEEDIIVLSDYDKVNDTDMYFESACIGVSMDAEKYFVDAGCYDGKDIKKYMDKFFPNELNSKICAFEPDYSNYKICERELANFSRVRIYNCGLAEKHKKEFFISGGEGSRYDLQGDVQVQLVALDDILGNEDIGFIKMDVEGYEECALQGCKKIITTQYPMCAISVYHKRTDIWRIPKLLMQMNPNYIFYMRHYTMSYGDTVLYAVDKRKLNVEKLL